MNKLLLTVSLLLPATLAACGSPERQVDRCDAIVGDAAPDLQLAWLDGSPASSLADLRGRVVLLEFWRTW